MQLLLSWDLCIVTSLVPHNNDVSNKSNHCLLDGGQMDSVLQEKEEASCRVKQATIMLQQATHMLKEHSIDVVKSAAEWLTCKSTWAEWVAYWVCNGILACIDFYTKRK